MKYLTELANESFEARYPVSSNTQRVFEKQRVFDYADQLTDQEESLLEELISGYERLLSLDLVIVTLNESLANYELEYRSNYSVEITPDKYVMVYADKFWEDNKFGYDSAASSSDTTLGDGIILVDNLAREPETGKIYTWVGTTGDAMYEWNSSEIDHVLDEFYKSVDTNYYQACMEYLQAVYATAN